MEDSPFYRLAQMTERMMDAWRDGEQVAALAQQWRQACVGCRAEIAEISSRLESTGVSVDIVHGLELLERCRTIARNSGRAGTSSSM
jgi:site-specific recombinase